MISTLVVYKRQFFEVLLDFCLICISCDMTFLLRFEGIASDRSVNLFFESLPVLFTIKLGCFFYFGL